MSSDVGVCSYGADKGIQDCMDCPERDSCGIYSFVLMLATLKEMEATLITFSKRNR